MPFDWAAEGGPDAEHEYPYTNRMLSPGGGLCLVFVLNETGVLRPPANRTSYRCMHRGLSTRLIPFVKRGTLKLISRPAGQPVSRR